MKYFLLSGFFLCLFGACHGLQAQTIENFSEESQPQCFNIINKAPYTVFGSLYSNFFTRNDGVKTRHQSNFRLETEHYARFCTSGPFYDGHKLELVLKTIVPIFRCKTGIHDDIIIEGHTKPEGGTETKARCI